MRWLAALALVVVAACSPSQQAQQLYTDVMNASVADLQQAADLAYYNNNKAAIQCWPVILQFVKAVQSRPKVQVGGATAIQVLMDLTDPDSTVNVACAAYRQAIKERVQTLIGKITTFAASVAM